MSMIRAMLSGFPGPAGSLFALAADLRPAGDLLQLLVQIPQNGGNVDVLGTGPGALAAAHAGGGALVLGQSLHPHTHVGAGRELHLVIHLQQHGNIQSHGTAVAAVTAAGAGHRAVHALGDVQQNLFLLLLLIVILLFINSYLNRNCIGFCTVPNIFYCNFNVSINCTSNLLAFQSEVTFCFTCSRRWCI